jgi:N-acetyl sugar amidotransferase
MASPGLRMAGSYIVCNRCVLDTTVSDIRFDENGVCNYCKIHDIQERKYPPGAEGKANLDGLLAEIKRKGRGKKYDCIVGVSGGTDSTYTLLLAKRFGLRPLAVHFDNGWNSEISVSNIRNSIEALGVDLYTVVADWKEFSDLQRSFLKASVPDAEVPTDYAIYSVLFDVAAKKGIKYVLQGHSFRAEGTSPKSWTYMDGRYIRSVHRKYGKVSIKSFPIMSLSTLLVNLFLRRIKEVRLLEHVDYRKAAAKEELKREVGWADYGGHHHESHYTRFFQSYMLPKKFNIDKRKTELSAWVRSGQMPRDEALRQLRAEEYPYSQDDVKYALKKLDIPEAEFEALMKQPPRSFHDFPTYYPLIRAMRWPIKMASRMGLVPEILYLKYGG